MSCVRATPLVLFPVLTFSFVELKLFESFLSIFRQKRLFFGDTYISEILGLRFANEASDDLHYVQKNTWTNVIHSPVIIVLH